MIREEYFELHRLLKEVIKGSIYVGINEGTATVIIKSFKGVTYRLRLDEVSDKSSTAAMADEIERRYHSFLISKFFIRRGERNGEKISYDKRRRGY